VPKLFLKCSNCKAITEFELPKNVSSSSLKSTFGNRSFYCEKCQKDGLGKILLSIVKFDWEKDVTTRNQSSVPTNVPLHSITDEELKKNVQRELGLIKTQ
jgi:hypothetical protein